MVIRSANYCCQVQGTDLGEREGKEQGAYLRPTHHLSWADIMDVEEKVTGVSE